MERPFICAGNKYTLSATNTIGLPVSLENLPLDVMIGDTKLFLKSSFHVSLVCINEIIKKYKVSIPSFKNLVVKDFCDFVGTNNVDFLSYIDNFKYVSQDDLKTVIVMCQVSNLDKFFKLINKKYGLSIEYPPTHVTLYAHDGRTGIFLTDSGDIKKLTKSISNPIGRSL